MESPCRISALFISARDIPRRRSLGYKLLIEKDTHSECRRTQRLRPPLAHLGHVVAGLTPGKGSGDRAHSRGHGCRGLEKAVLSSTWGGVRMCGVRMCAGAPGGAHVEVAAARVAAPGRGHARSVLSIHTHTRPGLSTLTHPDSHARLFDLKWTRARLVRIFESFET